MRTRGRWLAVCLAVLFATQARAASDPLVRAELLNGVVRVILEGSYSGARYTVERADSPAGLLRVIGEQDALCTGDCYVLDPDALAGATYWYRFDLVTAEGAFRSFGPYAVTIGAPAAGLATSSSPNPIRDRGTLRVTAAIPAGARAGSPAVPTGLPGDLTLVDTTGRPVRTLWSGTLDRLAFDVPFVARDNRGQPLPPGLYFVVLRAGSHRSISRVAIVR